MLLTFKSFIISLILSSRRFEFMLYVIVIISLGVLLRVRLVFLKVVNPKINIDELNVIFFNVKLIFRSFNFLKSFLYLQTYIHKHY